MAKFLNSELADLAHQLTLSPKRLRLGQIEGIDRLLGLVDADRAYPYDFVCYHITDYRKNGKLSEDLIPGKALISDLVSMSEAITRKANIPVADLREPFKSHDELARDLSVSTKTIRRWRSRGLMGIWVVFEDGVHRLAFLKRSIDRFTEQHKELVSKGSSFRQLTQAERIQIIERAREILSKRRYKLNVVARLMSEETGRAIETIRYTLRRYDRSGEGIPLFVAGGEAILSEHHRAVWRCREAGESIESIARAFDSTTEETSGILRSVQLHLWRENPLDCIHNELFDAPDADRIILDAPEPPPNSATLPKPPKELPSYLRSLYAVPLLTPGQERDLFRRYNYLKYKVARAVKALSTDHSTDKQIEAIKATMDQIQTVKQRIIRANLRLVVSIAKKHVGWSPTFFDAISDGNVTLLRAIEKFDYARGNKFSTYATWAIVKTFARSIPEKHYHCNRYVTGQDELLSTAPDHRPVPAYGCDVQKVREALAEGMNSLTEREREIVTDHFGLSGTGHTFTLEQLGKRYGITKERIRQIERRALDRLRDELAPSLVDAIIG